MKRVRLSDPIITPDGEETTIDRLAAEGRIKFSVSNRWVRRDGKLGTAYFADYIPREHELHGSWEIGKYAYESRTKTPSSQL